MVFSLNESFRRVKVIYRRSFLLFSLLSLCLNACARPASDFSMEPSAGGHQTGLLSADNDFYRGLIIREDSENYIEAVNLFENSLESANLFIRQAASDILAVHIASGTEPELSSKTVGLVKNEAAGIWAHTFKLLDDIDNNFNKEDILAFLLGFEAGVPFTSAAINNEARLYVLNECEKHGIVFDETLTAVINGHFASVHTGISGRPRYVEALGYFRGLHENGSWPARLPALFLQYPSLINDLGRVFQYAGTGNNESHEVFLRWDNPQYDNDIRYRLLFYAARIARQRNRQDAVSLFERALLTAPEAAQKDACIWYIMDSSIGGTPNVFIERLSRLMPELESGNYLDSILERFLQMLFSNKEWRNIIRVFNIVKDYSAVSRARYAWTISRIIEEGWLSAEDLRFAALAVNSGQTAAAAAAAYHRISYDAGIINGLHSLYYRYKSASALGLPFLDSLSDSKNQQVTSAMQFVQGFFAHGISRLALVYIRQMENTLSNDELRFIAQLFNNEGMYSQAMRLVALYLYREDYNPSRQDLELMFPAPYRDITEKYSAEYGFEPSLMYALMRIESAFQNAVVSHAGAIGLTQLMNATANEMIVRMRRQNRIDFKTDRELDFNDPQTNIHIGTYYLNYLMDYFSDDLTLSLLAYNGGMGRVRRWRAASDIPIDLLVETIPVTETRNYGRLIYGSAAVYKELYYKQ